MNPEKGNNHRWLEANELGHFGRSFVVKQITGKLLFQFEKHDLFDILGGDATPNEKEALWELVTELRSEKKVAATNHWQTAKKRAKAANIVYRSPSGKSCLFLLNESLSARYGCVYRK